MKRFFIILIAVLCALTGFARATDNKTFERFYNLTPKEFEKQLNYYALHNLTDSAMLCANIQASKYGKEKLSKDEIGACCLAFRYMGMEYINDYSNYQLATGYFLKAEQIADKYGFKQLQTRIAVDQAILTATQNDLENNFVYNKNVIAGFINAFYFSLNQNKEDNRKYNKTIMEMAASNLLYLAIKFDRTREVTKEVQAYREAQEQYGSTCNIAEVYCNAAENCNVGNYGKAFMALQTPITRSSFDNDRDFIQIQAALKVAQYAVLLKCGKRGEALNLLLQQEHFLRENKMTFELLEVLQLIKQHYEVDGNEAMTNKYSLLYFTAKDEFINKSRLGKMDEAKLNIELEQTRDKIQEMSFHQRIQSMALWSAVVIALLALTILAVLYVHYRKTKRTNRMLYDKNLVLLNANKQLMPDPAPAQQNAQEEPSQEDRDLLDKITAVMESCNEIYDEGFGLSRLAELVDSNTKYVSRAINNCRQSNFSALLNEYRIKEACRRLMDTATYGSLSIEGVARSVGYKSRSNFTTIFKGSVGISPSAFQRLAREGKVDAALTPAN